MSAYPGLLPSNITIPIYSKIILANAGFAFEASGVPTLGDAIAIGLRSAAKIEFKAAGTPDVAEMMQQNFVELSTELPAMQNDIPAIYNALNLSRAPIQMLAKTKQGKYINIIDNAGDFVTATGTGLAGVKTKFTLKVTSSGGERTLDYMVQSKMDDVCAQWLVNTTNMATAQAGGTGGSTLGLTAQPAYDKTKRLPPSFLWAKIGGVKIGIIRDIEISFETGSGGPDIMNIPYCNYVDIKIKITDMQTASADLSAALSGNDANFTLEINTGRDIFKFISSVQVLADSVLKEGDFVTALDFGGRVFFNNDWATPDTIDNSVVGTLTFNKSY